MLACFPVSRVSSTGSFVGWGSGGGESGGGWHETRRPSSSYVGRTAAAGSRTLFYLFRAWLGSVLFFWISGFMYNLKNRMFCSDRAAALHCALPCNSTHPPCPLSSWQWWVGTGPLGGESVSTWLGIESGARDPLSEPPVVTPACIRGPVVCGQPSLDFQAMAGSGLLSAAC